MACKYWFIIWSRLWTFSIKLGKDSFDFKTVGFILCFYAVFAFWLLLKHGNVEINHGPKKRETRFFSCFHWNVNRILAHSKLSLLEARNNIHQYDILCISKTHLESSVSIYDTTVSLPGWVVFVCIIKKIYLWEKLMFFSFLKVCCVK